MTVRPDVLLAILVMALATFLCRAGGYAVLRVTRPPRFVQDMLGHLPGAIFVAFLAPALALLAGALALRAGRLRTLP